MNPIIQCYRNRDEIALGNHLANQEERRIVALWIQSHPAEVHESPMLADLRQRITPGAPVPFTPAARFIEEKILAGQTEELLKCLPGELSKQIHLIKTHFELKTLILSKEWLPLLLDHVSTKDIRDILKPGSLPDVSSLSTSQTLRLRVILNEGKKIPSQQKASADIEKIKKNEGLTRQERLISIALYIETHRLSLTFLRPVIQDEEFLELATYLRYVDLTDFENIELGQQILKKCSNLNELELNNDRFLEGITALPLCQSLICNNFTALTALPSLPLCEYLKCFQCPTLKVLPELPHVQKLYLHDCRTLEALPQLPLCAELTSVNSIALTSLPELPLCVDLDCKNCNVLAAIPALPLCTKIKCKNLPALTALPELPLCAKLDVEGCSALAALPLLSKCIKLDCRGCSSLSILPPLPVCEALYCAGCPLRELPEIPSTANVYSVEEGVNALPFNTLDINLEKFSTHPVDLLLLLGDHLLKNLPFPNIYYFEKGVRNQAIDCGGVRRDFVTKLCCHLFGRQGLKLEDNFPSAASPGEENAYRSLGALLAKCYPANSYYKTGPLFDPAVYRCLQTPNPGSDEWFLTNYLQLVNAPQIFSQEVPQLTQEGLSTLAYLVEPDAEDISRYTPEYFSAPENRAALGSALLEKAKQDGRLIALSWMAHEFTNRIPNPGRNLQEMVEGILNQEALKRQLTFKLIHPKFAGTRAYLTHWIDHHPDQLEKFVYAVTGIRTLCANRLVIEVYDRVNNFIPVAHTCSFTLELSGNYENQAVFDEKMKCFLDNALAGSGFSAI